MRANTSPSSARDVPPSPSPSPRIRLSQRHRTGTSAAPRGAASARRLGASGLAASTPDWSDAPATPPHAEAPSPAAEAEARRLQQRMTRLEERVAGEQDEKEESQARVGTLLSEVEEVQAAAEARVLAAVHAEVERSSAAEVLLRDEIRALRVELQATKARARAQRAAWVARTRQLCGQLVLARYYHTWLRVCSTCPRCEGRRSAVAVVPQAGPSTRVATGSVPLASAAAAPPAGPPPPLPGIGPVASDSETEGESAPASTGIASLLRLTSKRLRRVWNSVVQPHPQGAVCPEKAKGDSFRGSLRADLRPIAQRLVALHNGKEGTVLDELAENFVSELSLTLPAGDKTACVHHDDILSLAARELGECVSKGGYYAGTKDVDLLVMRLYTMAGADIDRLMLFDDVPQYGDAQWAAYAETKGRGRNTAVFSEVNRSLRQVASDDAAEQAKGWETAARWVKTICRLHSLCTESSPYDATSQQLSRGLTGLPQPVVDAHVRMQRSDEVTWPAPSSCTTDPEVAESYIRGSAANSVRGDSSAAVLFSVSGRIPSLRLQQISQYPSEEEVLVPPLAVLRVRRSTADVLCHVLDVSYSHSLPLIGLQDTVRDPVAALHAATSGSETDEQAVYSILGKMTSQAEWDDAKKKCSDAYGTGDVVATLHRDLSKKDLATCSGILGRRGIALGEPSQAGSERNASRTSMPSQRSTVQNMLSDRRTVSSSPSVSPRGYSSSAVQSQNPRARDPAAALHHAIAGSSTDEQAVYGVLEQMTSQAEWDDVKKKCSDTYGTGDVVATLHRHLSKRDLATCSGILGRRGIVLGAPPQAASERNASRTSSPHAHATQQGGSQYSTVQNML
eukprot:Rhum_TRINITY_DN14072_c0_g1::Rhum_TRINITY_DN14072_c0_g1_i4::g.68399::m.68399